MDSNEVAEKVKEYEYFIEDILKKDLREIEKDLNGKLVKYNDWDEIKTMTEVVKEFRRKNCDMLVRVDIGRGIFMNGEICDYERTYVNVGLGIILEMDCDEAARYSNIRLRFLKKEIDHCRKLAVKVKVHIKMVLLAINELQQSIITSSSMKF